ncbi:MAG TPA: aspartyl beta-hydroxylase, partial [Casimicrobiaceae bacterium]|nr:aspartyl beta-hydroxylase [Casimicrobiaceae bacterium]
MENDPAGLAQIAALEAAAVRAAQSGRDAEADSFLGRILEIDPNHERTLTALGQRAFRKGDFQSARVAFQRLVDADGSDAQRWIHLALACQQLQDEPAEESAIQRALSRDPVDLVALILRASLLERQGKTHQAAQACAAVAQVSPPLERLRPDLRPAVSHALTYWDQYGRQMGVFLDQYLEVHY